MSPGEWILLLAACTSGAGTAPPPTEGAFDFVVETAPYSEPSGEGPFDFKVS